MTNVAGEVRHPQWTNVGAVSSHGWCSVVFRGEAYIFGQVVSHCVIITVSILFLEKCNKTGKSDFSYLSLISFTFILLIIHNLCE